MKTIISARILVVVVLEDVFGFMSFSLRQYYLVQVLWVDGGFSHPLSRVTFPAPLNP
jgi:hypothetical protein